MKTPFLLPSLMETDGIFDGKIAPKFLKILEIMIIEIHSHTLTAKNPPRC